MALQLNRATAEALFKTFDARFNQAMTKVPTWWDKFSSVMPSTSSANLYHWIAQIPGMQEWVGARQMKAAILRDYTLTNKAFEQSIKLDKFKVSDDQYGAFSPVVDAMGQAVMAWPDQQIGAVVNAGNATACFDGQFFFDTDHPVSLEDASMGTYSNNLIGSTYNIALDPIGVWQRGSEAMAAFVGDEGRPLAVVADTLMVPTSLRRYAVEAAKAELIPQTIRNVAGTEIAAAAPVSNIYRGDFNVIVNPYLSNTTPAAYIMCCGRPVMPFIWQLRQVPVFTALVDPTLPNCFQEKEFVYGTEGRAAPGYSLPFLAVRCAAA